MCSAKRSAPARVGLSSQAMPGRCAVAAQSAGAPALPKASANSSSAGPAAQWHPHRRPRGVRVGAGTDRGDARALQCLQRLRQALPAPVEHVVVGQHAGVDARCAQHADVARVHAVVDALAGPCGAGGGDRRLEVDDAQVGLRTVECGQRIAPDGLGRQRHGDRAVGMLGQPQVVARIAYPVLVQHRIARLRQGLVDATAGHHVAGEEQAQGVVHLLLFDVLLFAMLAGSRPGGRVTFIWWAK